MQLIDQIRHLYAEMGDMVTMAVRTDYYTRYFLEKRLKNLNEDQLKQILTFCIEVNQLATRMRKLYKELPPHAWEHYNLTNELELIEVVKMKNHKKGIRDAWRKKPIFKKSQEVSE